ncbi:hypothetical protein BDN70DRAFT_288438 [Pholiota conissans]|uniref:Uncharacterized protein n=1 Tax=Pholiota conissans TaxID=109636 RepID=A0A9P6CW54_9AGAR|nr:hypothetical protein BDN70DRAFT_288438 [Pholiota conissans]
MKAVIKHNNHHFQSPTSRPQAAPSPHAFLEPQPHAGSSDAHKNHLNAWCGCRLNVLSSHFSSFRRILPGAETMKCAFFILLSNLTLFVSNTVCLTIAVSPQALANAPTLVAWTRGDNEDSSPLTFDLRLVQNDADVSLALANLNLEEDTDFGNGNVVFPSAGTFVFKAVTGSPESTMMPPPSSPSSSTASTSFTSKWPTFNSSSTA